MRVKLLLVFALLITIKVNAQSDNKTKFSELDKYFENARIDWDVPGLAIGIIYKDSVYLLKGYGVRETGTSKRVNKNTLFAVASNTKSFTATAIGMLVDEGKLNWEDKVTDYLPWFRLYDPCVTANMTIRDLLCHRSGLATFSGDLIWYGSTYTRDEVIKRASGLKPTIGFRAGFGYSNIMYLTAGQVVAKVSGMSWDEFVSLRILKPLGMLNTNTSVKSLDLKGNTALPHNDAEGKVIAISYLNWDNIGPAGSLNSSASDMLKWINLQLHKGKYGDKQLISEKSLREMWSPQTIQKVSSFSERIFPSTHFKSYGMGWSLMDYHGFKVISHSGGYDGMISFTGFVPESQLGFVILTNKNSSLYFPLSYKILDSFLSSDTTDWSRIFLDFDKKGKEDQLREEKEDLEARISGTSPTLPLTAYAGTYRSSVYGDVQVIVQDSILKMSFVQTPIFHSPLEHWQYNTFRLKFPDVPSLPHGKAAFILNLNSEIEKLLIDVPNPDFDFTEFEFVRQK